MGTLFRQTPNNGYPFPPKWPLKMGTGLEASASHPRPNNIWVPPPPPPPPGAPPPPKKKKEEKKRKKEQVPYAYEVKRSHMPIFTRFTNGSQ